MVMPTTKERAHLKSRLDPTKDIMGCGVVDDGIIFGGTWRGCQIGR